MKNLNIPVGISDFEKIRKNHYYYVDKSGLIRELLREEPAEVTLITRPRRFGKTLGMSMLASFFDHRKDNRELFQGLEIMEEEEITANWMNQWPTIFFTFKDIDGLTFSNACEQLRIQVSELCKEHSYLLDCEEIDPDDKVIFQNLKAGKSDAVLLGRSLSILMRMMQTCFHKQVILLLDEYDVPAARASSGGYYVQMMEILRNMMSTALKDNRSLRFAVVTGCLKLAKESIFTGTNNFVSDTITDSHLNEYFGFTQADVERILKEADAEKYGDRIKEWYDGYHFGNIDVYCPWDVMNYLRDLQRDPEVRPAGYWKNTSDNSVIRSFIDSAGSSITRKMEKLLAGESITERIDENLTYDYLHSSEENLWSILYLSGYLTSSKENREGNLPDGKVSLAIPNAEIREIFENTVVQWFNDNARIWNRNALFEAVWSGNDKEITSEMSRLLRRTISYHDYREDYYHAFLAGIFTGAGYVVESNREHGEGRSDVVICDPTNDRAAVFEVKYAGKLSEMEEDCNAALRQIADRMYAEEYEEEYDTVFCYGITFYKKRCLVREKGNGFFLAQ